MAYNKAISLRPDYVEAYSNLGVLLQENGKIKEAIECYKKAISIKPIMLKLITILAMLSTIKAN